MAKFELKWTDEAATQYATLQTKALARQRSKKRSKSTKDEGLFKQIRKTICWLAENPRHPGLQTHPYDSLSHPFSPDEKVFEAYAQNRTPGAYRVFWCYGPGNRQITIIAITPHP